jgi:hypothetical protein
MRDVADMLEPTIEQILLEIDRNVDTLNERVLELETALNDTLTKVNAIMDAAAPHIETAGVMMEQFQNHPMAKMFGLKGTK